jgi:hypothetical protein
MGLCRIGPYGQALGGAGQAVVRGRHCRQEEDGPQDRRHVGWPLCPSAWDHPTAPRRTPPHPSPPQPIHRQHASACKSKCLVSGYRDLGTFWRRQVDAVRRRPCVCGRGVVTGHHIMLRAARDVRASPCTAGGGGVCGVGVEGGWGWGWGGRGSFAAAALTWKPFIRRGC